MSNLQHINNKFAKAWWIEGWLAKPEMFNPCYTPVEWENHRRQRAEEAWIEFCNQDKEF